MMKLMMAMVVIGVLGASAFAGDPGGVPGFAEATFSSTTLDTTSDIAANVSRLTCTPNLYPQYFGQYTTVGARAYMYLEGGVTYNFRYYYCCAYATLIVNGQTVLSKGTSSSTSKSADFTPTASDWYPVELRAGSEGTSGGIYSSSYYGLQWKKVTDSSYSNFADPGDGSIFKTGAISALHFKEPAPVILSSAIRANDSTILDVTYMVTSDKPTVNVRALAFEDGERSFWKVVRPETFVKDVDGNETAQNIGDGIAANVEHKLSWKVSSDWKTDLAKVKFEVLTSEMAQLPLKTVTIPAVGKSPEVKVYGNSQTAANCFNALLWYYADSASDLQIEDGYLYYTNGSLLQNRTLLSNRTAVADVFTVVRYVYDKMGYEPLGGVLQNFVKEALRKETWFNSTVQYAIKKGTIPSSLYIGEKAYWWVDLTTGESGHLDSAPLAGWGDEYKTKKLLMRRIESGDVKMGGTKPVTISEPFYIGVFEVTQKQYALINGSNPSSYKGDMRPVECVSYNDIRGTSKGAQWPSGTEFDDTSWLGKVRAKVGVAFDLPTESQWEFACRAGTTTYFNNGGSSASDLSLDGRWYNNRTDGKGGYSEHTTVGSYLPNAWGLYDMHGNVCEWCLDWYGSINSDPATDWAGAASGSERVRRGGFWSGGYYSDHFPSSARYGNYPWNWYDYYGFRLCCSAPAGLQ